MMQCLRFAVSFTLLFLSRVDNIHPYSASLSSISSGGEIIVMLEKFFQYRNRFARRERLFQLGQLTLAFPKQFFCRLNFIRNDTAAFKENIGAIHTLFEEVVQLGLLRAERVQLSFQTLHGYSCHFSFVIPLLMRVIFQCSFIE